MGVVGKTITTNLIVIGYKIIATIEALPIFYDIIHTDKALTH